MTKTLTLVNVPVFLAIILLTPQLAQTSDSSFEALDRYVVRQMENSRIPGAAIAIAQGGNLVHSRGFGHNVRGQPVTAQTPFWIGSNTKSFTALAVMQLVESGDVELDAPVQRYLPAFRLADVEASSRITVRHLLNQTSGLSRSSGIEALLEDETKTLEETVRNMRTVETKGETGESYQYSNLNSVVLGLLLENVSGKPWQEYIRERIFLPLEMQSSAATFDGPQGLAMTAVHSYWFGYPARVQPIYRPGLAPSGYLVSTAEDMARYLSMYLEGGSFKGARVLSSEGIDRMLAPATGPASSRLAGNEFKFRYGMGWFLGPFGAASDARWHLGQLESFNSWMVLLPGSDQAVVVLVNANSFLDLAGANGVMSRIPIGIVNMLLGEPPPDGNGLVRFYLFFDTLVLLVIGTQVWFLARTIKGTSMRKDASRKSMGKTLVFVVGAFQCGAGLFLISGWPLLARIGWKGSFRSVPDLTVVVLAAAVLSLATGMLMLIRFVRWHGDGGEQGLFRPGSRDGPEMGGSS
jgi:CubicO group peptidase (beta-lactamase class C family)